jgi:uncharacterized membrane protein
MMIAAPIGGRLAGKVQPRYVIAGSTLVAALGLYFFSFLDPRSTAIDIIWPLSLMAFGMGFGMAQRTNIIATVVPAQEIGIASSILALARNIAGAFGIAVFGTILSKATESNVLNIARNSTIHVASQLDFSKAVALMTLKAEVSAYSTVFIVSSIVLLAGAILALWIKVGKDEMKAAGEVLVE